MTVVSFLSQLTGRFCQKSMDPAFAHLWVSRLSSGLAEYNQLTERTDSFIRCNICHNSNVLLGPVPQPGERELGST